MKTDVIKKETRDYRVILGLLREKFFLTPDGKNIETLVQFVKRAVEIVISGQGSGPVYPVNFGRHQISEVSDEAVIPLRISEDPMNLMAQLPVHMQGSVKASNPFMVKNITPPPTLIHLATYLAVSIYMPNAVTGEDAAEVLNTEIACASAVAKLAGYNPKRSAGVFTFGGTGTNLYAFKIGLMKAMPEHGMDGLKDRVVIIGSKPSHYSHQTAANWLGIGQNNYLQVGSHTDQTTKLDELENACRTALTAGEHIACIEAVGGTTSNMAIDDIEAIFEIRERLVSKFGLSYKPHIHADTVLGWVYLNFVSYDFEKNPLGFSKRVLLRIKKIVQKISKLKFADSWVEIFCGIWHSTGSSLYFNSG